MFTGIVTDVGSISSIKINASGRIFFVNTIYNLEQIDIGCSISCNGVCLTVTDKGKNNKGNWFSVDISQETLSRTNLGELTEGSKINLEKALKIGDELGGHLVTGHVDDIVIIKNITEIGDNRKISFQVNDKFTPFITEKGSVTLNGVSLTINEVSDNVFCVNLIPHSLENTTFTDAKIGSKVNLEIDTIARYLDKLIQNR